MNSIEGHHVKGSWPGSEKQKAHVFSHAWKTDPKINIYTKTSIIIYIYKLSGRICL
jgi:hypothetical protein